MHTADQGSTESSFSSPYGSSLRNSRVLTQRRGLEKWSRHAITMRDPDIHPFERVAPFTLVVSPDGRHGALTSRQQVDVLNDEGVGWFFDPEDVTAFDDSLFLAAGRSTWDGAALPKEYGASQPALVRRIGAEQFCAVWKGLDAAGGRKLPPALGLLGGSRVSNPDTTWNQLIHGYGVAAIAEDFTAFVAVEDQKLHVYAPRRDSEGHAILEAQHDTGMKAEWISLIESQVHLLAASGAGTQLRVFTRAAKPVYSLNVPFQVLQPAIAGAAGRVYLAGKGLAALDNGKVTWTHATDEPLYASSFVDGSLAVANGKRLDFLKPDGVVDQSFEAQEPLVAPPAIASDGSVWAASASAIYVAR